MTAHLLSPIMDLRSGSEPKKRAAPPLSCKAKSAFGCPRDFLHNRFVYAVVSPRARGLSIGINMNPDKYCNFDCVYCEVSRATPGREPRLDVDVMSAELQQTLALVQNGKLRERPNYFALPDELFQLR